MPVPGGEITSTDIWQAPVVETVEEVVETSTTEEELVQDDLPELS